MEEDSLTLLGFLLSKVPQDQAVHWAVSLLAATEELQCVFEPMANTHHPLQFVG